MEISSEGMGLLGPGLVALDYGDDTAARMATTEVSLSGVVNPDELGKLCSRMLVGVERRAYSSMQKPRIMGHGALPLEPKLGEHERGVDRTELLTFSNYSPSDIELARHIIQFETLLNQKYTDIRADWDFQDRVYREKIPAHVLPQV